MAIASLGWMCISRLLLYALYILQGTSLLWHLFLAEAWKLPTGLPIPSTLQYFSPRVSWHLTIFPKRFWLHSSIPFTSEEENLIY